MRAEAFIVGPGEAVTDRLLCLRPGASTAHEYESLFTEPTVEEWLSEGLLDPR